MKRFVLSTAIITVFLILIVYVIKTGIKIYEEEKGIRQFKAKVIKVYDGDTVKIEDGRKVRLLGINAPELHHPDLPVQKYGEKAKRYLEKRVLKKECTFEYNIEEETDKYGRLLAYIYVDGELVNAELVKKGYAPF